MINFITALTCIVESSKSHYLAAIFWLQASWNNEKVTTLDTGYHWSHLFVDVAEQCHHLHEKLVLSLPHLVHLGGDDHQVLAPLRDGKPVAQLPELVDGLAQDGVALLSHLLDTEFDVPPLLDVARLQDGVEPVPVLPGVIQGVLHSSYIGNFSTTMKIGIFLLYFSTRS